MLSSNINVLMGKHDLAGIADYLKTCKNVIVMSGAGISTSAGIPDFRSPQFGLYDRLEKYNLPYPEAVFSFDQFKQNPRPFYDLAKELYPTLVNAKPTKAHYFIKLLSEKGILLRHYTQNIDGLDHLTGLPSNKIIEAHGHIKSGSCVDCKTKYSFDFIKDAVLDDHVPMCTKCTQGVIKPDVVLFGEGLPNGFWTHLVDFKRCDLLVIMGTSLAVQPFASLAARVSSSCPRLLLNRENVGGSSFGNTGFLAKILDPKFDSDKNSCDVFHAGNVDDSVVELANLLGWKDDFMRLIDN